MMTIIQVIIARDERHVAIAFSTRTIGADRPRMHLQYSKGVTDAQAIARGYRVFNYISGSYAVFMNMKLLNTQSTSMKDTALL